jgi:hypothetical protein
MRAGKAKSKALDGAICGAGSSRTRSFAAIDPPAPTCPDSALQPTRGNAGVSSGLFDRDKRA